MLVALLKFVAALGLASALHVAGLRVHPASVQYVDFFLVLTLYHAFRHRPASSALAGTATGLALDALSGGLYGLHGFANTLAAFMTSTFQTRMMIHQLSQVGLLLLMAAALQQALLAALQFALVPTAELPGVVATVIKMLTTCGLGIAIYAAVERWQSWRETRRATRALRPSLNG
jgi:rod shape-determining protein MreD